jgi:hypothetical protein
MNTTSKSVEELLKTQQEKYRNNIIKETREDEILTLIDALEFCEKNYEHNHEGVERYVRSNHLMHDGDGQADLPEIFRNIRKAVTENDRLSNYGHADMLTRSLLEYQRNGTPRTTQTGEKLKEILQPIFSND